MYERQMLCCGHYIRISELLELLIKAIKRVCVVYSLRVDNKFTGCALKYVVHVCRCLFAGQRLWAVFHGPPGVRHIARYAHSPHVGRQHPPSLFHTQFQHQRPRHHIPCQPDMPMVHLRRPRNGRCLCYFPRSSINQSIFISKYMHILHSVHRHSCLHFKILLYIYFQETNINLRLLLHSVKIQIIS